MNTTIETGDILLIRSKTFLSKSIQWFMKLFGKEHKYNTSWIASHAGTFLKDNPLRIGESVDSGFKINVASKHYDLENDDYVILTPRNAYTEEEKKKVKDYIFELQTVSISYQFWNFLQWPVKILSFGKIDLFGKGKNRGITYCYESTARIMQYVRPHVVKWDVERTDFFKLYENLFFKIKVDKRKL